MSDLVAKLDEVLDMPYAQADFLRDHAPEIRAALELQARSDTYSRIADGLRLVAGDTVLPRNTWLKLQLRFMEVGGATIVDATCIGGGE